MPRLGFELAPNELHDLLLEEEGVKKFNAYRDEHPDRLISLAGLEIVGLDLSDIDLTCADIRRTTFRKCSFRNALLDYVSGEDVMFEHCMLDESDADGAIMPQATFISCSMRMKWTEVVLDRTTFVGSVAGLTLYRCSCFRADFTAASSTTSAKFTGSNMAFARGLPRDAVLRHLKELAATMALTDADARLARFVNTAKPILPDEEAPRPDEHMTDEELDAKLAADARPATPVVLHAVPDTSTVEPAAPTDREPAPMAQATEPEAQAVPLSFDEFFGQGIAERVLEQERGRLEAMLSDREGTASAVSEAPRPAPVDASPASTQRRRTMSRQPPPPAKAPEPKPKTAPRRDADGFHELIDSTRADYGDECPD
jgi:uncharacterized protein YjbI with pentapeptide repeats